MSSEKHDSKPESVEPAPLSGAARRRSSRAPSAWGEVRDAVSAVHNLGALLRSSGPLYKVILDLLPELRSSGAVLRDLFATPADPDDEATREVCAYGVERASRLVELFDATALANDERDDLAARALALAVEIEGACDLLALLERAALPVTTPLSVRLVAREAGRQGTATRGDDIVLRFDEATPEAALDVDPYVMGSLLMLLLALVRAAGARDVVLRASGSGPGAVLVVEPSAASDTAARSVTVRVHPAVPPAARVARRVAQQVGATLQLEGRRATLRFAAPAPAPGG